MPEKRQKRKMYCNCDPKDYLSVSRFREVEATEEGLCVECGYYAVEGLNFNPKTGKKEQHGWYKPYAEREKNTLWNSTFESVWGFERTTRDDWRTKLYKEDRWF